MSIFGSAHFQSTGKLNNRNLDDMVAGARVAVAEDKEHPADFVLWKSAKAGEESWPSRFGPGRPGWHIECSAMSMDALGETFDIHGGGPDLKFPHHENEIAQSEAATGCRFAQYWMHAGAVRVKDEKMSKSLGNFVTLAELFREFHPQVIRFFLLQSHYRSAISFSDDALVQAEAAYTRLVQALPDQLTSPSSDAIFQFQQSMDDDFNTPRAIALLFDLAAEGSEESASSLLAIGKVLGLFATDKVTFLAEQQQLKAANSGLSDAAINALIAAREQARKDRDFLTADKIRDDLVAQGVVLEDAAGGTSWHRKINRFDAVLFTVTVLTWGTTWVRHFGSAGCSCIQLCLSVGGSSWLRALFLVSAGSAVNASNYQSKNMDCLCLLLGSVPILCELWAVLHRKLIAKPPALYRSSFQPWCFGMR